MAVSSTFSITSGNALRLTHEKCDIHIKIITAKYNRIVVLGR